MIEVLIAEDMNTNTFRFIDPGDESLEDGEVLFTLTLRKVPSSQANFIEQCEEAADARHQFVIDNITENNQTALHRTQITEDYLKYDRELLALLNDVTVAIARDSNKQLTELSTRIENILASL